MKLPKTTVRPIIIIPATFHPLNFIFRMIYNFFALIGISFAILVIVLYVQGWRSIAPVDTQFIQLLGNFLERTLENDVATALVFKIPVNKNISLPSAVESLKQMATQLDIKFLSNYQLHKDFAVVPDKKVRYVEILAFTLPNELELLFDYNADIAAHLPLHIAAYEDAQGENWLAIINWDFLIHGAHNLPTEMKIRALRIQDNLLKIIGAAATGS
jgi:uncharacterized protein (DUF302 family)